MEVVETAAENCTLTLDHVTALNISNNISMLMRLYNMCQHTWDPEKTWDIYYWNELAPPLVIYRSDSWFNYETLEAKFVLSYL